MLCRLFSSSESDANSFTSRVTLYPCAMPNATMCIRMITPYLMSCGKEQGGCWQGKAGGPIHGPWRWTLNCFQCHVGESLPLISRWHPARWRPPPAYGCVWMSEHWHLEWSRWLENAVLACPLLEWFCVIYRADHVDSIYYIYIMPVCLGSFAFFSDDGFSLLWWFLIQAKGVKVLLKFPMVPVITAQSTPLDTSRQEMWILKALTAKFIHLFFPF